MPIQTFQNVNNIIEVPTILEVTVQDLSTTQMLVNVGVTEQIKLYGLSVQFETPASIEIKNGTDTLWYLSGDLWNPIWLNFYNSPLILPFSVDLEVAGNPNLVDIRFSSHVEILGG